MNQNGFRSKYILYALSLNKPVSLLSSLWGRSHRNALFFSILHFLRCCSAVKNVSQDPCSVFVLHLSILCIAPLCGLFFMQNLRQTDFMFHTDSTNGVWRPKTGEEETEDTLLIPANALKWPHQSGIINWCLLYYFGTTKEQIFYVV